MFCILVPRGSHSIIITVQHWKHFASIRTHLALIFPFFGTQEFISPFFEQFSDISRTKIKAMRVDNIDLYLSYVFLKTVKFKILIPFYVQETIYCKAILPMWLFNLEMNHHFYIVQRDIQHNHLNSCTYIIMKDKQHFYWQKIFDQWKVQYLIMTSWLTVCTI